MGVEPCVAAGEQRLLLPAADPAAGRFAVSAVERVSHFHSFDDTPERHEALRVEPAVVGQAMKTCVPRPCGTAKANATVPRRFDLRSPGSSSANGASRHFCPRVGLPLMPDCAQLGGTRKK